MNTLQFVKAVLLIIIYHQDPVFISSNDGAWIVEQSVTGISNGRWLLSIDDRYDAYDIALLPGHRISVTGKANNFTCGVDEVNTAGKVVLSMIYNNCIRHKIR